ncbi:hypothetical protein [Spiroplasma poulsonii]|nr:hypothetical protein [Spiroplasma poulsonii]UNF61239.1 hypothetical protein MNU24_04810 [Spiroplasma poulsonii]
MILIGVCYRNIKLVEDILVEQCYQKLNPIPKKGTKQSYSGKKEKTSKHK